MYVFVGYRDELAFLSEEARPQLKEIDSAIKEKLQQARESINAARDKHGYSVAYKSAKRKRQKGKSKMSKMSATCSKPQSQETSTTAQTDSVTVSDSEEVVSEKED